MSCPRPQLQVHAGPTPPPIGSKIPPTLRRLRYTPWPALDKVASRQSLILPWPTPQRAGSPTYRSRDLRHIPSRRRSGEGGGTRRLRTHGRRVAGAIGTMTGGATGETGGEQIGAAGDRDPVAAGPAAAIAADHGIACASVIGGITASGVEARGEMSHMKGRERSGPRIATRRNNTTVRVRLQRNEARRPKQRSEPTRRRFTPERRLSTSPMQRRRGKQTAQPPTPLSHSALHGTALRARAPAKRGSNLTAGRRPPSYVAGGGNLPRAGE